jgi:hypothetical protein
MDTLMIKKSYIYLLISGAMLMAGSFMSSCYYDSREELFGNTTCDTTTVTYSATILPILEAECLLCHSDANAAALGGGAILEGYDFLMDYVTPADPDNSSFYNSVAWVSGYSFMPKSSDQLSDCNISKIRAWINAGALNN